MSLDAAHVSMIRPVKNIVTAIFNAPMFSVGFRLVFGWFSVGFQYGFSVGIQSRLTGDAVDELI